MRCSTVASTIQPHWMGTILPLLDRQNSRNLTDWHSVMWLGAYELQHCLDIPWRVVLNEYVELAKEFGGTDGHKYVNGVLNGLAPKLRPDEVAADRAAPPKSKPRKPAAVSGQTHCED